MSGDIHSQIDRACADKGLTHEDAETMHAFADFLADPSSRCPICLGDDHTRPSQCPEVTDAERRRYGVMQMDVVRARQVAKIGARRADQ